ncbi:TetR/AcrR family transcriptional regulator [Microbulbifer aggregans]|uniref:TetR/AcrR family transcriptional regulator n=1 Tax=Microbulbifer aggregans TaxID=1769779 RepID=UPI001CFD4E0F|nr:TetR/AcrR family transcriptional regulator [Microbulbifer aggregans]
MTGTETPRDKGARKGRERGRSTLAKGNGSQLFQSLVAAGDISDPVSPRGRLIIAAARLFQQRGFARATVRDIAAEVGILSGSIFHHVKSKEDLLCEVMLEVTRFARSRMAASVAGQHEARGRLLACIRCELEAIHGLAVPGFPILVSEWRSLSAANQKKVLVEREQYEAIWLQVLAERPAHLGIADPHLARKLLLGALSYTHSWFKPRGRGLTLEELAGEVLVTVWPPIPMPNK